MWKPTRIPDRIRTEHNRTCHYRSWIPIRPTGTWMSRRVVGSVIPVKTVTSPSTVAAVVLDLHGQSATARETSREMLLSRCGHHRTGCNI